MTIKTIRTVDDILDRVVCDLGRGVRAALRRAARGAGLMSPLAQAPQDRAKALDGGGQSRAQIARADLSRSLCGRRLERHDVAAAFLAAHERAAGRAGRAAHGSGARGDAADAGALGLGQRGEDRIGRGGLRLGYETRCAPAGPLLEVHVPHGHGAVAVISGAVHRRLLGPGRGNPDRGYSVHKCHPIVKGYLSP